MIGFHVHFVERCQHCSCCVAANKRSATRLRKRVMEHVFQYARRQQRLMVELMAGLALMAATSLVMRPPRPVPCHISSIDTCLFNALRTAGAWFEQELNLAQRPFSVCRWLVLPSLD